MECKCAVCGVNEGIEIKILEESKNLDFDLERVAKHLGWKLADDEEDRAVISREKHPSLKIVESEYHNKKSITVFLKTSKKKFSCLVSLVGPLKMVISRYQRIKKGRIAKEIKDVVILDARGYSIQLADDSHGFFAFGHE
ncbi:MAG: hypothetical protein HYW70_00325 [Candidatus Nealsonbacteria bacterium]|nr:hypothetical protein [Candidatus Nealsonbacteria bacterium]